MANNNFNTEELVKGFAACEAMLDQPSYASDIATGSMDQIIDSYNESREEVDY